MKQLAGSDIEEHGRTQMYAAACLLIGLDVAPNAG